MNVNEADWLVFVPHPVRELAGCTAVAVDAPLQRGSKG